MINRNFNNLNPIASLTSNPKLFESTFGLADTASPVTNIVLRYKTAPAGNSSTYVLAVAATAGTVAPVIFSQPSYFNVFESQAADLSVTLSAGSPPLAYQWQEGGVDLSDTATISGSTSAHLVISPASLDDSGQYQVIITNAAGGVTSAPIRLTVMSTNPDVTLPGDLIVAYQPYGASSPAGQGPDKAIGNTTDKYLNYGANGGTPFAGTVSFVVTPSQGGSIVTGVRFYTANDIPARDPIDFYLEGSTDGTNYYYIAYDTLSLPDDRNPVDAALDPTNQHLRRLISRMRPATPPIV